MQDKGVYRIEQAEGPEFLVALANDDLGDYSFALARAVPIPGAGFTYDDTEINVFVSREPETENELFTSYHDGDGRFDGREDDLIFTGMRAELGE